jgi:hypothetical protein
MALGVQLSVDLTSPLSYLAVYFPSILRASLDLTAPRYGEDFFPCVFRWIYWEQKVLFLDSVSFDGGDLQLVARCDVAEMDGRLVN